MALSNVDFCHILYLEDTVNSIQMSNVFYYKADLGFSSTAENLKDAFNNDIVVPLLDVLSASTRLTRQYVFNLVEEDDFVDVGYSPPFFSGTRSSIQMPPFVGWYFRYVRPTRDVRSGRKTFGTIAEGDVSNGVATGAIVALLVALETALEQPITTGLGNYNPCIAKTTLVPNPSPPPDFRRVPITLYPIDSVVYERVSTQNTRKS